MRRARPPLDAAALDALALGYVGRFATTQAKLAQYLRRKLAERGWTDEAEPPVEAIVARLAASGFVDDRAFADARGAALGRRGYGARRVAVALKIAGVGEAEGEQALAAAIDSGWDNALAFARRRRIGPYAAEAADRAGRERATAALIRAGHPIGIARRIAAARPGKVPERDD
ncbi:MAG: RecX family transcriptional regulator [Sphingomonadaceae bacterium]|nr:RecX family transcriptional regulator [Sphingomonadaceae bacterium]